MPSTSDVNRSAQRKGGKKGRRSRAGGAQLSSYDAAGASMALPRDNLSECQTPFRAVPFVSRQLSVPPASASQFLGSKIQLAWTRRLVIPSRSDPSCFPPVPDQATRGPQ